MIKNLRDCANRRGVCTKLCQYLQREFSSMKQKVKKYQAESVRGSRITQNKEHLTWTKVDKQKAWSQPHASNMKNMQGEWTGLSSRTAGEWHLISLGWLHRKAFLLVPKLQCGGWNGENGVWRIHIRSRHVPWHNSELPVGMTLLFTLLNRIIFFVFWPVLCLFLYYSRAWYKTLLSCS